MKYPSPADIEEMRARGYDASVISEAVERSARWHEKEGIKELIASAFLDVRLGDGVGLREALAVDGYADSTSRARARVEDEKLDWRAIEPKSLSGCCLAYFDASGMRFHLPAYLCADLDGGDRVDLLDLLTSPNGDDRFVILSDSQRAAVVSYLTFVLGELPLDERLSVQVAIESFWGKGANT
jgi:hypothetical protein